MDVKVSGSIGLVTTGKKRYIKTRKGYFLKGKWVKKKKTVCFKDVKLKTPYMLGDLTLTVNKALIAGGIYVDDVGEVWVCTDVLTLNSSESTLRNRDLNIGQAFHIPTDFALIAQAHRESSAQPKPIK